MKASKWLPEVERWRGCYHPQNEKIAEMLSDVEDLGYRRGSWDGFLYTTLGFIAWNLIVVAVIKLTR